MNISPSTLAKFRRLEIRGLNCHRDLWSIGLGPAARCQCDVAAAEQTPPTMALAEVIEMLGRHTARRDLVVSFEPRADPVPDWLRDRLIHTAHLLPGDVDEMTGERAMQRWELHMTAGE